MRKRKYTNLSMTNTKHFCDISEIPENITDPSIPQAQIHNLVGTAMIKSSILPLDLSIIARLLPNVVYDRQKFAAITIRLSEPVCTSLLFTSGKMVLTGCKNFPSCVLASHYIVKILRRGIPNVQFNLTNVQIQNIVGNVDLNLKNQKMDLQRLYDEQGVFCTYQRNMFPGLIYRPDKSPVVLLIFVSGKIVVTGGRSSIDVFRGWHALWPFIKEYIKDDDSIIEQKQ